MPSRVPIRRCLPLALALALVTQSCGSGELPRSAPAAERAGQSVAAAAPLAAGLQRFPGGERESAAERRVTARATTATAGAAPVKPAARAAARPASKPAVKPSAKPAKNNAPSAQPALNGRNHVWSSTLRINRPVSGFPCSRSTPPGNYVYRWGCAGRNNIYLLGHAYSVFKTLHDAYVRGGLRAGMQVTYADADGRVTTYRVTFWKVVSPVDSDWAWAAQSRPSMTLQTCVGARSQWRLIVRLVAA